MQTDPVTDPVNFAKIKQRLADFLADRVLPAEAEIEAWNADPGSRWRVCPRIETLKREARALGLWNLFLPDREHGAGLNNRQYAELAELMGRSLIAPELCNCNAPDTGNMELLHLFGNAEQKRRWLMPLLAGEIRSGFAMTEPAVASSDATNIALRIARDGEHWRLSGRKWWTTGAADPRCKLLLVMGVTDPESDPYHRHSIILVPIEQTGVRVCRPLTVFGYDDAPYGHVEIDFDDVRVPATNLLGDAGHGFLMAQARLGPGRIHHCMRLIGMAQRALEMMLTRACNRVAFGRPLGAHGMAREAIALSRCEIEQARLLTLHAAEQLDRLGNKGARDLIGMIKIVAPRMACNVLDRAIQLHGGAGLGQDVFLARAYAGARALRIADGPDEVHIDALARSMLKGA